MINSVRYVNFKRYKDVTIDLGAKITILVGPNSSGKSSIIKGLLAFKQTYDDPTDHTGFVAEGGYVDIGHFNEYVRNHNTDDDVSFVFEITGFQTAFIRGINTKSFVKAFISIKHEEDPQTKHGRVSEYTIYLCTDEGVSIDEIDQIPIFVRYRRMQKSEESFKVEISYEFFSMLRRSSPQKPNTTVDEEDFRNRYDRISQKFSVGVLQAQRDNQRGMLTSLMRGNFDESAEIIFLLERAIVQQVHAKLVEDITQKLYALAALREKPSRSVKRTDERRTVGSVGENTASVYFAMRQRSVKAGARSSKLQDDFNRLDQWFKRLKLGTDIEINSWRDLIDMRTKTEQGGDQSDSVVDIGVGFSQVAPILVQLAAMPEDAMLITEQPELHLYPWAQAKLGRIFCEEAARSEKRIVIETHSEHLIGGVQIHVSEGRTLQGGAQLRAEDIQILYIGSDAEMKRLHLNPFGEFISDWPSGFFDQTIETYRQILKNKLV